MIAQNKNILTQRSNNTNKVCLYHFHLLVAFYGNQCLDVFNPKK